MTDEKDSMQFTLTEHGDRSELPENVVVGDFSAAGKNEVKKKADSPAPAEKPPAPAARFAVGDWIRFYGTENILNIAKVEYIKNDPSGRFILFTDRGVVPEGAVVEVRREALNDKPAA